jgi:aminoglycoside phosphotransferase (APT) family kinase protein
VLANELQSRLEPWLLKVSDADSVTIIDMAKLSGGAIQENWSLSAAFSSGPMAGMQKLVVRTDALASVSVSHSRANEFSILRLAFDAGVKVPEPLWCCDDQNVLGLPFFVMRRIAGTAAGHKLTKDSGLGVDLLQSLAHELSLIHTIKPAHDVLTFLPVPEVNTALRDIEQYQKYLDEFNAPHPILEWGLSWLERNIPDGKELVLTHQDFRTGNYMVDDGQLTGILDWEFGAWGDPMSDIGWFCAKCWRFGANHKEAGGIGDREDFYKFYESQSGRNVDTDAVVYWEVMAHVRWAIVAIQQGNRFMVEGEQNLEAALTAHVVPELELEIMGMTGEAK